MDRDRLCHFDRHLCDRSDLISGKISANDSVGVYLVLVREYRDGLTAVQTDSNALLIQILDRAGCAVTVFTGLYIIDLEHHPCAFL